MSKFKLVKKICIQEYGSYGKELFRQFKANPYSWINIWYIETKQLKTRFPSPVIIDSCERKIMELVFQHG